MSTAIEFSDIEDAITESLHELTEESLAELFNQVCLRKVVYKADDAIFVELRLNEAGDCVYCGGTCWEQEDEDTPINVCIEQFEDAKAADDYIGAIERADLPDDIAFTYANTI